MILPFQMLRYTTKLSVQDAVDSLREVVTDVEWGDKTEKPFIGDVNQNSFMIRPRFGGSRNSFMPYASGKLIASANGTAVRVLFLPNPVVLAFCVLFVVFCAFTTHILFTLALIGFLIAMIFASFPGEAEILGNGVLGSVPPQESDPKAHWVLKNLSS